MVFGAFEVNVPHGCTRPWYGVPTHFWCPWLYETQDLSDEFYLTRQYSSIEEPHIPTTYGKSIYLYFLEPEEEPYILMYTHIIVYKY